MSGDLRARYLKVHAKLLLITRRSSRGIQYTAQLRRETTRENFESIHGRRDMTSNEDIANDIILFFSGTGNGLYKRRYRVFSVSPDGIRVNYLS
jgi:polyphosphate kinase